MLKWAGIFLRLLVAYVVVEHAQIDAGRIPFANAQIIAGVMSLALSPALPAIEA